MYIYIYTHTYNYIYIYIHTHLLVGARAFLPRPVEGVPSQSTGLLWHATGRCLRPEPPLPPCRRGLRGTGALARASCSGRNPQQGVDAAAARLVEGQVGTAFFPQVNYRLLLGKKILFWFRFVVLWQSLNSRCFFGVHILFAASQPQVLLECVLCVLSI